MTQIKNNINTYADLTAYNADTEKDFPNVSYIQATDEVKWVKEDTVHMVAVYNVTSTSSATKLLGSTTEISYQIIDGVKQDAVQMDYTFDTLGEHIVKYKLSGTSIYQNGFYHCTALTSVTIPSLVTSIGICAFEGCTALTSVGIGSDVTSINNGAFRNCTALTSVTIPNSVTSIGNLTFYGCSGLTNVRVGNGVTNIGDNGFNNVGTTTNKATFIFMSTTPPTLVVYTFTLNRINKIYVPAESVEAYKAASGWSSYASKIQAIPNS